MKYVIKKTAWTMVPPEPYSAFHIWFLIAGITLAVFAAYYFSKKWGRKKLPILLFVCGVILTVSEIYKQLFLYYVVNGEVYDWWYFPFQLCSLPMYFCMLIPLVSSEKVRKILYTFMQDFNLLGGVMALAEPTGLLHPYWTLTLHGLLWHILLIFIGLSIAFCRASDTSIKGFFKTLPLFAICCVIASIINVSAKPQGQADMFYISPYHPSCQIVFHQIALVVGTFWGNVVYLLSVCTGGFIFHLIFSIMFENREKKK